MIRELLHLLGDPAHWAFEAITDLAFAGLAALAIRPLIRHHDRRHHPRDVAKAEAEEQRASAERRRRERAWARTLGPTECFCFTRVGASDTPSTPSAAAE